MGSKPVPQWYLQEILQEAYITLGSQQVFTKVVVSSDFAPLHTLFIRVACPPDNKYATALQFIHWVIMESN